MLFSIAKFLYGFLCHLEFIRVYIFQTRHYAIVFSDVFSEASFSMLSIKYEYLSHIGEHKKDS